MSLWSEADLVISGRSLYKEGGLTTSMDFGLWEKDNIRRIKKQIRRALDEKE